MTEFDIINFLSERIIDFKNIVYNIFFHEKVLSYVFRTFTWHLTYNYFGPIVFSEMWVRCADTQGVLWYVRKWNGDESARRKMRPGQEIQRNEKLHSRGGVQRRMVCWTMEQGNAYMHFEIKFKFLWNSFSVRWFWMISKIVSRIK